MPFPFPNLPLDQRGQLHRAWVHAPCLVGNVWNDPADRELLVYTPAGYEQGPPLPAVLLLPGFAGTGEGLLGRGLSDMSITSRIDRLVAQGCPPFIAVLPDVMTSMGGSQFVDSPGIGNYLTYLTQVIRPYVDAHFRTTGRWGAAGRSSGGFGAFNVAVADPAHFRAIAFHAGDAGFDLCYLGDLPTALRGVRRAGGVAAFLQTFWQDHRPGGDTFAALNILAMSCAYSPDPGRSPLPARLPFDVDTGAIDFDVFASWRRHDPVIRAQDPAVRAALQQLDLLFIDAGAQDEYHLQLGARRLVAALQAGGVQVEHDEFPGGHRGTAWRYDVSLPKLARALTDGQTPGTV